MAADRTECDCDIHPVELETGAVSHGTVEARLVISGMHCDTCARRVCNALVRVGGVASAAVRLHPPVAHVVYDPDQVTAAVLCGAVARAGRGTRHTYRAGTLL
ncbi:MAG: hypothetical protein GTN78_24395 [Gemmatimonadales bacterium]|nr:hypothetical protein [Gemmatimonadales bacterium]NIN12067.1 hypothetical protein [Gemmatimonadales bacterium]NIR03302.1 hypothetical protein [Gemmatimonadales bacterium]NIS66982.1 hypothetical protein [Gemmatimonadales bacterium]